MLIRKPKKHYNKGVIKAGTASSNKTGLVYKISIALVLLLGLLVYKLNAYFKNDKTYAMEEQIRKHVVSVKTSVSGQLTQLKNTLSSYESDISEANINWVQLAPFFAIAKVNNVAGNLKVSQIVVRSNTPAERWNANYIEKALLINKSKEKSAIIVQLFKDRANTKYILIRFATSSGHELVVASTAEYFQKYFDIERGNLNKSLLITTENILAAHTEGDYIANSSKEAKLPASKYISEKEEIVGTNLSVVSYVLKKKIVSAFAIPWSILGVVVGFGFILIGILFYGLEPIEKRIERYKKQEREQLYKDTVKTATDELTASGVALQAPPPNSSSVQLPNLQPQFVLSQPPSPASVEPEERDTARFEVKNFDTFEETKTAAAFEPVAETAEPPKAADAATQVTMPTIINLLEEKDIFKNRSQQGGVTMPNEEAKPVSEADQKFLTLDEDKIDLDEIEKALALDDFDEDKSDDMSVSAAALEKNLQPQKISLSKTGAPIERPEFALERKDFKVDDIKVSIRRPERS